VAGHGWKRVASGYRLRIARISAASALSSSAHSSKVGRSGNIMIGPYNGPAAGTPRKTRNRPEAGFGCLDLLPADGRIER